MELAAQLGQRSANGEVFSHLAHFSGRVSPTLASRRQGERALAQISDRRGHGSLVRHPNPHHELFLVQASVAVVHWRTSFLRYPNLG
jgi:hypothetical protein